MTIIDFSTVPPLISDHAAINSVVILCGALCVGAVTSAIMAPRAGPAFQALNPFCTLGSSISRRRYSSGSIGTMSTSASAAGMSWSTKIGHVRVLAIFVSAVMHVGQAVNCIIYYVLIWKKPEWAHAPASFLADLVTIVPGAPLVCMSMIYRIALVLVTHPQTRSRLLLVTNALTFIVPIAFFAVVIGKIAMHWDTDIVTWQGIIVYTPSTGPIVLLLPLLAVVVSIWSIRAALTQQAPTPSTATTWEPVFPGDAQPKSPSAAGTGGSSSKPTVGSEGQLLDIGRISSQHHSQITSTATADTARSSTHQGGLSESLKSTFLYLTVAQAIYWSAYLFLLIVYPPLPMRVVSITVTLSTLSCATEAAFESILRRNQLQLKERAAKTQHRKGKRNRRGWSMSSLRLQSGAEEKRAAVQGSAEIGLGSETGNSKK